MAVRETKTGEYLQALEDGLNVTELSRLFHRDRREVQIILRDVKPNGVRMSVPIYRIDEAAKYLVKPNLDVEEYIKKLRPNDLPPLLTKEFWAGQLNKQKYELQSGNLWPTDDVMAVFANVFKILKQGILLFSDTIEARTELSEKQRSILNELSDGLLVELHRSLIEGDVDLGIRKEEVPAIPELIDDGLGD